MTMKKSYESFSNWMDYQKTLIYCGLEDMSASEMLTDLYGGQYGSDEENWRKEVALFLFYSVRSKLLIPKDDFGLLGDKSPNKIMERYANTFSGEDLLWMGVQFQATEKLEKILVSEDLLSWEKIKSSDANDRLKDLFFEGRIQI